MNTHPRVNIETGQMMTDSEIELSDLKAAFQKSDAAQKEKTAALEKRVSDLEAALKKYERKAGHDADGNLIAAD